ncbi:hypothetical protein TSUD_182000 [Trifolium subterraneum]|uniref:Seipin n=1 Tax=Trifolium subterraneum TaxID=3900 RepID=A0A2Z6PHI6_TRISU|nr:hypothetical protein TSUD_182000 [Trifolium subterraneum]
MEENQKDSFVLPTPADLIYNSMVSVFSPLLSLLTVTSESYRHGEGTKDNAPSQIAYGSIVLLKKLGLCFLSAAYVCMILFLVLILAFVVGVGLVRFWVEEPVIVHESLHFDYTDAHPTAVFSFNGGVGASSWSTYIKKKHTRVPVGHAFSVSLSLLMPESDFNRELGVFQLTAELLSVKGNVIAKSSQPCMLRPLIFLVTPESFSDQSVSEEHKELQVGELLGDERDVSELLRKWRHSRSKRKTIIPTHDGVGVPETTGSSASSISMTTTREDVTSVAVEDDDIEDSESVCTG